ncbi:uncharacterized protein AMSG_03073 [Thecamonas trahens ATCC 50062]|uniref:Uncharacterized protein n=1 Tax=Thecamonas trahens ATCC 50062 TaxID=461836 RepID=A0A0L0D384_THETB|nr:hypothetical protein AMSG_03073 [Thecamonas trahens ATCC 50062]KNC46636.1 hypothetical protein AMSG_03073 [Thecamonas trahens ATCC 50062]|eukprot:XP_013760409.1 hypothetical protein AMSG_03073 [Thecamonas trahens ATCC 50062]
MARGKTSREVQNMRRRASSASRGRAGRRKPSQGNCCKDPYGHYENEWLTSLCGACANSPGNCCYGLLCPCCFAYSQRKELLDYDMSQYKCCDNRMGCLSKMVPCVSGNESCCLCLETCCCSNIAVHINRSMVQEKYHVRSSCCDKSIICAAYICVCIDCLLKCGGSRSDESESFGFIADCFFCSVMSCMLSQQQYEINNRDPYSVSFGGSDDSYGYESDSYEAAVVLAATTRDAAEAAVAAASPRRTTRRQ